MIGALPAGRSTLSGCGPRSSSGHWFELIRAASARRNELARPVADQHSETGPIPRLALDRSEAAAALGMSLDSFERHVQPTVRMVRLGRMRLVPISELERWLAEHAERTVS